MQPEAVFIRELPELETPVLIAGFGGWGDALGLSSKTAAWLDRNLKAERFARFNPDLFCRYDQNRPVVHIDGGRLIGLASGGGRFSAARTPEGQNDVIVLQDEEPQLGWNRYVEALFDLCRRAGVRRVITVGSMLDQVLHTDRVISGIASDSGTREQLGERKIVPITYHGPTAIHSLFQAAGPRHGVTCISLWCHCPFYLQNTVHFGLQARLIRLLASLGGFAVDTGTLEEGWEKLKGKIGKLVENDPKIKKMIAEIRGSRSRGSWENFSGERDPDGKVISLEDFRDGRD